MAITFDTATSTSTYADLFTDSNAGTTEYYRLWVGNSAGTDGDYVMTGSPYGQGWVAKADVASYLADYAQADTTDTDLWISTWSAADGQSSWAGGAVDFSTVSTVSGSRTTSVTGATALSSMFSDSAQVAEYYNVWIGDGATGGYLVAGFGEGWIAASALATTNYAPTTAGTESISIQAWTASGGAGAWESWDVTYAPSDPGGDTPGSVFTLTSSTDGLADFTGTANADYFDAPIQQNVWAGGVSNSLSTADRLDGGAGTDTLHAELVPEFYGVTGDNVMDVQPHIANIEDIQIEAMDVSAASLGADVITVDAKNISDVVKIGSSFSDGDLTIENLTTLTSAGTARNTEAVTITMDHTDNFNSDNDASDLTVYFDEDYLLSGQTKTTSQANYWLLDEDSPDYTNEPLLNIERDGVQLTIDGEAVEIRMETAVADAADTWDAFAEALQDRIDEMVADGSTVLEGITVEVDTTNNDQTYNDLGNLVTIPAISLVDSQGRELVPTGFTTPDEATGAFDIFGRFDNEESQLSDDPVTVNIELEKVGRDGEGGNLVVGGKDLDRNTDTDVDQVDGIEVFNISVLGDEDKPSNLGRITSTNQALETVNIKTDDAYDDGDTYASLTVRGDRGDLEAEAGSTPFGGSVETINAAEFKGDLIIGNNTAAQDIQTLTATGGGDVNFTGDIFELDRVDSDIAYTYTTGSGADTVTVNLDGDAVDTIGESFSVSTGSGDDTVTITMDAGVSYQTMAELDNLSINTSSGEDTVNLNAYGTFDIDTGDGSDFVRINSVDANGNATTGTWTFGDATGPQDFDRVLYKAEMTVSFAGFEETVDVETDAAGNFVASQMDINNAIIEAIDNNEELSLLLDYDEITGNQALTITSTVGGQNTLAIALYQPHIADDGVTADAGEVTLAAADETALAQGLIDTGAVVDSEDVDTTDEIIAEMNLISGSIDQDGVGDTITYTNITNDVAEVAPDGGDDIFDDAAPAALYQSYNNGGSSDSTTRINLSTINPGNGSNDLVVLHSNDNSVNIIEIDAVFGKASVVNFHNVSTDRVNLAAEVGDHALDFSTFLDDQQDASDNAPNTNIQSQTAIVTTVNNVTGATAFADSVVGSSNAAANSVNIIRFDGSVDTDDTFAELNASTLVAALNDTADDGDTDFGNLTGNLLTPILDTDLVGSNESHIIMVENDQNEGEYKVFSLTSTWDTDAGETTSVSATDSDDLFNTNATELGTLDFGASVNLNVVNAVVDGISWSAFIDNLELTSDGEEPVDVTAPTLVSTSPVDDATSVKVDANLSLTFSETVAAGKGNFTIVDASDDSTVEVIAASAATFAGTKVTLNPKDDLAAGTEYEVTVDATAVKDAADNAFAGFADDRFSFTTEASGGPTEVAITNGSIEDADGGAFQFNASLTATDIFSANIDNFTADDVMNIDDAYLGAANLLFDTTGTTEINFAFGDMTDYTPSFTINLTTVDAALVADVEAAADSVAALGILDTAWGAEWLI